MYRHLTNRIQLHSPLVMRVDLMPEPAVPDMYMPEPEVTTPILNWEDDLEMWSRFLERKVCIHLPLLIFLICKSIGHPLEHYVLRFALYSLVSTEALAVDEI